MKKLLLSLIVICTCTCAHAQKISDFSVVTLLQKDVDFIDSATSAFIDAQKLGQETEADSIIDVFAKKIDAVKDYQSFLDRIIMNEIDGFCFNVRLPKGFNTLGTIYIAIAGSHGRTYTENGLKLKLIYSISKGMTYYDGISAVIGKKKVSNRVFSKIAKELTLNEQQTQVLLFKISAAYSECLAAIDLQRMPESDRIAIKKALFMATPHITNL